MFISRLFFLFSSHIYIPRLLSSFFTYVARDRQTGKSAAINTFRPSNDTEASLFAERGALAIARKAAKGVEADGVGVGITKDMMTSLVERGAAVEDSK